ncbi:MAG: hypothetical protein ACUVQQ_14365, partial [Thermogutta sp.]
GCRSQWTKTWQGQGEPEVSSSASNHVTGTESGSDSGWWGHTDGEGNSSSTSWGGPWGDSYDETVNDPGFYEGAYYGLDYGGGREEYFEYFGDAFSEYDGYDSGFFSFAYNREEPLSGDHGQRLSLVQVDIEAHDNSAQQAKTASQRTAGPWSQVSSVHAVAPVGRGSGNHLSNQGITASGKTAQSEIPTPRNAADALSILHNHWQELTQDIIRKVDDMLREYPPLVDGQPLILTQEQRRIIAEIIADAYMAAVYEFLKTRPGARPKLGRRSWLLDRLGIQNEYNAPWCDDWATYIRDKLTNALLKTIPIDGKEIRLGMLLKVERGQTNWPDGYQHNYVLIRPYGRPAVGAKTPEDHEANLHFLFFDPWFKILPIVYLPGDYCAPDHFGSDIIYK